MKNILADRLIRIARELEAIEDTMPAVLPDELDELMRSPSVKVVRHTHGGFPKRERGERVKKGTGTCGECGSDGVKTQTLKKWAEEILSGFGFGKEDFKGLDDEEKICSGCARKMLKDDFGDIL